MKTNTLALILAAGLAGPATAQSDELFEGAIDAKFHPASMAKKVSHIYYNMTTGEQIISRVTAGQTAQVDTGDSELVWSCDYSVHQCEGINGHTGSNGFVVLDDPLNPAPGNLHTDVTWASMGDIVVDTLVDCVRFSYTTTIQDVDLDQNGTGDGVEGFAMHVSFTELDNGTGGGCGRFPIMTLELNNLAGVANPDDGEWEGFIFTVDLAPEANSGENLMMEIGDSDGDLQGAAFGSCIDIGDDECIPNGTPGIDRDLDGVDDNDLDGDGLFDWCMNIRFIQPGTEDTDGDGIIDGDVANQGENGMYLGAPAGYTPVEGDDGVWAWDIDLTNPAVATGTRSYMGVYNAPDANGDIIWSGFIFNSGFTDGMPDPINCSADNFNPTMTIAKELYSPGVVDGCAADINNDGLIDFFDVADFLEDFAAGEDYNGDGVSDFFDVADFLDGFAAGCP